LEFVAALRKIDVVGAKDSEISYIGTVDPFCSSRPGKEYLSAHQRLGFRYC